MRYELVTWYDVYQRQHAERLFSRLSNLTSKTLGRKETGPVKTKAAEARPLISFCEYLLATFGGVLDGELRASLQNASAALLAFIRVLRTAPRRMEAGENQERK